MFPRRRHVIVHYHIFKNAGSSVDAALRGCFGTAWDSFEGSHAHDIQSSKQLAGFLHEHQGVRAVSSHLARPPLPFRGCHPIVFLRHPLLRAASVYRFNQLDPGQPQHAWARDGSFGEFLDRCAADDHGLGRVVSDYQTFHLSSASAAGFVQDAIHDGHLDEAKALLRSWGYVGMVEHYGRSLREYQRRYARYFRDLVLTAHHENQTAGSERPVADLVHEVRAGLPPATYARFVDLNRADYALYDWAMAWTAGREAEWGWSRKRARTVH